MVTETAIHPTAVVDSTARLTKGVSVGAYTVIEEGVEVGEGTQLGHHVVLHRGARIRPGCHIHSGVVVGHTPMIRGGTTKESFVEMGEKTVVMPNVTIERGHGEGTVTDIGPECFIMSLNHIGHNSQLGRGVTLASGVALGGFSIIHDGAFLGGGAVQHQYCRVGKLAMIGGNVRIIQDVPPFLLAAEFDVAAKGLNLIGLRRAGFQREQIAALKQAYKLLYRSQLSLQDALTRIEKEVATPEALEFVKFIRESKRGICRE